MGRKPLEVNVGDLRKRLGQRMTVAVDLIDLDPIQVVSSRASSQPVVGELTVESIERGVSVLGSVTFGWESECRRCLKEISGSGETLVDEIFQYNAPPDSEIVDFDGEHADFFPVVRDAVMASLPLSPLCRQDCQGPDPSRYPALSEDELAKLAEAEKKPDPRWAALEGLNLD